MTNMVLDCLVTTTPAALDKAIIDYLTMADGLNGMQTLEAFAQPFQLGGGGDRIDLSLLVTLPGSNVSVHDFALWLTAKQEHQQYLDVQIHTYEDAMFPDFGNALEDLEEIADALVENASEQAKRSWLITS